MPIDVTATGDQLKPLMERVRRVVEKRNTVPILANVLLEASEDGHLTIRGTDLDIEARVVATGVTVAEAGAITVSAQLLADIARNAKGAIRLRDTGDGKVAVTAGKASFALHALPAEDFPDITGPQEGAPYPLEPEILKRIVACCAFAISTEETRYYLNGVHLHGAEDGDALMAVATDGHRLARLRIGWGAGVPFPAVIVPKKMIALLEQVAASATGGEVVRIAVDESRIAFETDAVRFIARLIDGTFPDYQRVIPQDNPHTADLPRAALTDALQTVTTIASERGRGVRFTFDSAEGLTLAVKDSETGTAEDRVACGYTGPEPMTIGFNGRYMRDALDTFEGETLEIALAEPGSPTVLTDPGDPDRLVVLMPMRTE